MRRGLLSAVLVAMLAGVPAGAAAKPPVYRYPPSFTPPKRPPAPAPAPGQPSVPLSSTGAFPDMVIDEAGTAHVVWTEGRGDQADVVVYCRLKRGEKACDNPPTELTWDKEYGTGDGPQFNIDNGGPRIVRAGDQLIVLSKRYPTIGVKPDGSSSSTLVAWASSDGGQLWSKPAAILGKFDLGQVAILVKGTEQSVLNFGYDALCPGMCVEEYTSAAYTAGGRDFTTGPDQNYSAALAIGADGIPTIAFADLTNHVLLRRWTGKGDVMDPATWSQSTTLDGEQPALAGGPSGTFLMSKPGPGKAFEVRPITADASSTPAAGAATAVSGTDGVIFNRLYQDSKGRLFAAWEQRGGKDPGVKLRMATPRAGARAVDSTTAVGGFDTAQTLVKGADNGQIALGATQDGGGFTVLNHTGGVNAPGQIIADGFGSQLNTGEPGLGDLDGGGDPSPACQTVNFGSFDIQAAFGCFIHGKGVDAKKIITSGVVDLYGLKLQADAGAKLVIDPTKLQILTYGQAKVWVEIGSERFVLWHGDLDIDLNRLKPGDPLFDFDPNKFAPDFFGFSSAADVKVFLQGNGVHVKLGLKLPSAFLGINGDVELVADRETGVHLDSFRIAIPSVALGAVEFKDFALTYNFGLDTWAGKGTLAIAKAGKIAATATFAGGDFKGASIDYQLPAPLPIGPFVYLKRVGGGFMTDPVKIDITGTIGAGVPVGGEFPITVDGHAGLEFPSEGGAKFQVDGKVYVLLLEVAEGRLRFQIAPGGGGYADFYVQSNQDFELISFNAKLEGWVDGREGSETKGQMSADFHGQICFNFVIGCLLKGGLDAAISQKGLAVCGSLSVEDVGFSIGVQFSLDGFKEAVEEMAGAGIFAPAVGTAIVVAHLHVRCHASEFRVPPPVARSAQAGGGVGLDVPGGLPTESFLVYGDGGVPSVDVVGPGATVAGTAPGEKAHKSPDGDALAFAPINAVLVTVEHPKAGTWTVQPRPGSPAIKQVKLSDGYRAAKPAATVVKGRSLRYEIADLGAGQTVRFLESGKFGHRILGDAKTAKGSFALPQDGLVGGKRTITALVQHDGLTTDKSVVARYVAPGPPKPARVRSIRVRRSGTTLSARWPAAKGAARYIVNVQGGKRLRLGRIVGGKHMSFDLVPRGTRVTVTVIGLSKNLVRGRARTVRSR